MQSGDDFMGETRDDNAELHHTATPSNSMPPRAENRRSRSARLVIGTPRSTGVSCVKGKAWIMTHVDIAKPAQCPDSVRFMYIDANGDEHAEAPTNLQNCGAPPPAVQ